MSKLSDARLPGLSEGASGLPKFYPCFWSCFSLPRQEWRDRGAVAIVAEDSVFNIIFKRIYPSRQREVSGECRGHETRHDG